MHSILFIDAENTRITPEFVRFFPFLIGTVNIYGNKFLSKKWLSMKFIPRVHFINTDTLEKNATDIRILSGILDWITKNPKGTVYLMSHDKDFALPIQTYKFRFSSSNFIAIGESERMSKELLKSCDGFIDIGQGR